MDEILRIAICEDEEVSRKLTLGLIHKIEQEVNIESFTDGSSFLSEFYRGKYDLILMDIFMPGITGVETVKRIRKIDDTVPITFLTSSAEHALDGYKYHVDRYLIKPLQVAQLKEVLEFAHEVLHKSSIPITCTSRSARGATPSAATRRRRAAAGRFWRSRARWRAPPAFRASTSSR